MKTAIIPVDLAPVYQSLAPTLALCWILKRDDGLVIGMTGHVADLDVLSELAGHRVRCRAAGGFLATDIAMTDTLSQNNLDVQGVIDSDLITEADIRAGLWAGARLEILEVNYNRPQDGGNPKFYGTIGNIQCDGLRAQCEQRGLSQPLEQNLEGITSYECDATLGDARCGVNLTPFLRNGTIATVTDDRAFTDPARNEPDGWWSKGRLKMLSGPSMGLPAMDVKISDATGAFEVVEPFFFGVNPGDQYRISPGCNKLFCTSQVNPDGTAQLVYNGDCIVKFANRRRFRGCPRVPGQQTINQYGGQGEK